MCHAYVYDALRNPVSLAGTNPTRAMQYAYLFVPEFVRVGHMNTSTEFVSLLFVESGGVKRSCHIRDPMVVARTWVRLNHPLRSYESLSHVFTCCSIQTRCRALNERAVRCDSHLASLNMQ